jgi:hypothetical protein
MFVATKKISNAAIQNILALKRFTYMEDRVIKVKGTGEIYYLQLNDDGVYAGYIKE